MHSKLSITFCILEIVSPEGNNCLLSSSVVAPFWRQMNGKKIFHLVGSQYAWLKAEQGAKAVCLLIFSRTPSVLRPSQNLYKEHRTIIFILQNLNQGYIRNFLIINRTIYKPHDSILCNFLRQNHALTASVF